MTFIGLFANYSRGEIVILLGMQTDMDAQKGPGHDYRRLIGHVSSTTDYNAIKDMADRHPLRGGTGIPKETQCL
jgi:hypothetical protein